MKLKSFYEKPETELFALEMDWYFLASDPGTKIVTRDEQLSESDGFWED